MNTLYKLFIFSSLLLLNSCYYDSEEYLFPEINMICDTIDISYAQVIQPGLQSYCYSCHSSSTSSQLGGNIKLEEYSDVKIFVDNKKLFGSINHDNGYSPMPKGGGKLDNCTINQFRIWIEEGSPNN